MLCVEASSGFGESHSSGGEKDSSALTFMGVGGEASCLVTRLSALDKNHFFQEER